MCRSDYGKEFGIRFLGYADPSVHTRFWQKIACRKPEKIRKVSPSLWQVCFGVLGGVKDGSHTVRTRELSEGRVPDRVRPRVAERVLNVGGAHTVDGTLTVVEPLLADDEAHASLLLLLDASVPHGKVFLDLLRATNPTSKGKGLESIPTSKPAPRCRG